MFYDRLHSAIVAARDKNEGFAVLHIDLDRFRPLNDSFGHELGDALLKKVAERISQTASDANTVARLGSDEFALLLDKTTNVMLLKTIATKLLNNCVVPSKLESMSYYLAHPLVSVCFLNMAVNYKF